MDGNRVEDIHATLLKHPDGCGKILGGEAILDLVHDREVIRNGNVDALTVADALHNLCCKPHPVGNAVRAIPIVTAVELDREALVEQQLIAAIDFHKVHAHLFRTFRRMDEMQGDLLTVAFVKLPADVEVAPKVDLRRCHGILATQLRRSLRSRMGKSDADGSTFLPDALDKLL